MARKVNTAERQPAEKNFSAKNERVPVDLTKVPTVPWAWVDEHVYAEIRGCSVKTIQRERQLNIGCRYKKINGKSVRYKLGDITAFLEAQPGADIPMHRNDRPERTQKEAAA